MIATLAVALAVQCPLSVLGSIWYGYPDTATHRAAGMYAEVRNETPRSYVLTGVALGSVDPSDPRFASDSEDQDPAIGQVHNTFSVSMIIPPSDKVTLVPIPYAGAPGNVTSDLRVECHEQ